MRISTVTVRGYRSLKEVTLDLDDYGVFIGANGSGKSSVLYALDWFFGNRQLADTDVHGYREGEELPADATVEVLVTFTDLTPKDRERLQQYGRGEKAQFRRTWHRNGGQPQTKYIGNAKQGEGFADIRSCSKVGDIRTAYNSLRERITDLPDLGKLPKKEDVHAALSTWESDPANELLLIDVPDGDATHMFGINGGNVLRDCVRLILVPAAVHIAGQVGEANRGSALNELIGAVMAEASARAQADWLAEHHEAIYKLTTSIKASVEASTGMQTQRINERLKLLVPSATVALNPTVPDWAPKADPSVVTDVTVDGITNDVSRQDHGIQRAVMISMLQALVPDEQLTKSNHTPHEDEDEDAAAARLQDELASLPSLVIAIEEPELYQHPARARSFARTLSALSKQPGAQIFLATHSPFFVRPDQFHNLHRFTLRSGVTGTMHATVADIATRASMKADTLQKSLERTVPTEFSEGFFADKVVLVEGSTDRAVLEAVSSHLGHDLDALGVSVLEASGKQSLHALFEILSSLSIPTYVLVDGDFGTAARKNPADAAAEKAAHQSHMSQTDGVIAWLPSSTILMGSATPAFGATTISENFTVWEDDVEEELCSWPSLVAAATALKLNLQDRSDKNAMLYRQAIMAADPTDVQATLSRVVKAIVALA